MHHLVWFECEPVLSSSVLRSSLDVLRWQGWQDGLVSGVVLISFDELFLGLEKNPGHRIVGVEGRVGTYRHASAHYGFFIFRYIRN